MIMGFVGIMGCFEKGTIVKTIEGDKPIEKASTVLSYDGSNIVSVPCGVNTTKKIPYKITFDNGISYTCSEEHPFWNGKEYVLLKHLKKGDIIPYYHEEPISRKKPLVETTTRERNMHTLPIRNEHHGFNQKIRSKSRNNNKTITSKQHPDKTLERTIKKRNDERMVQNNEKEIRIKSGKESCLQTWSTSWTKEEQGKILINSETGEEMGMFLMPEETNKQEFRSYCASQGWEQQEQLSEQFNYPVPILSRQCTFQQTKIRDIQKIGSNPIIMYDLIVPNTNNFLLGNGVITHNSGKTLAMTREAFTYWKKGLKENKPVRVLSNYHLNFPYEHVNFEELFKDAENQKPLRDVVILLDEIHILLDSRSGMSKKNKILTFWLNQTRKSGVKLLFTTQYEHQIDKRLRSGTDFLVHCEGRNLIKKNGKKIFKCLNTKTNGETAKTKTWTGDKYFCLYDTNEIIKFFDNEAVKGEEGS